ncbi:MAG: SMC-Scp complex subunit ScpB [Hyphomicrobiaceae bacterium]
MRDDDDPETSLSGVSAGAAEHQSELRILEARLFAADKPLSVVQLAESLPDDVDVPELLSMLQEAYDGRGVQLVCVAGKWCFRTAEDLAYLLEKHIVEQRRLSRAALETLAIISYHQPVTRAEIEEVRGVSASRGTLDALMELGWVRPRGRRRAPGKPVTYGTTEGFLVHFGLESLADLPGLAELKGAGLLDAVLPPDFRVPQPKELAALLPDELPLEDDTDDSTEQSELDLDDEELFNLLDDDSEIGDDVLKSTKRDQERP